MREIIIKIPDTAYEGILNADKAGGNWGEDLLGILCNAITHGTLLPKGHGRLVDGNYLLGTLLCEDYETCVWRNCSECNREKCIKRRDILDAPTIIEESKTGQWIDDKCSACGKGIDDLIDSCEWYRLEKPKFCPFCGIKLVKSQESESKRYAELSKSYVQGLRAGLAESEGRE